MRRARARYRPAVLMAALVLATFGASAGAREARLPVSAELDLVPGASLSLAVSSNPTFHLHAARGECRRWQAAAATLGETYAGHLLRKTVVRRQCRFLEAEDADEAWDWPWTSLREGRVLPPRLHAAQGEWEIRCGHAGDRRRCALINRSRASLHQGSDPRDYGIVTHFVVDTVAGREALLWRLFVPAPPAVAAAAAAARRVGASAARGASGGRARGEVRYTLEEVERAELFPACTPAGCLMEAGVRRAGDVATRLWEGLPIDVRISLANGAALALTLPAAGFRAGLKELVRLRRAESRSSFRD